MPPSSIESDTNRQRVSALRLVDRLQPALRRGERGTIVEILHELIDLRAPLSSQWLSLSVTAANNGEVTLARRAIDLYIESCPGDPGALHKKVALLSTIGLWDEAYALLRELAQDQPDPLSYAYSRGTAALYVGDREEARSWLERAIRLQPLAGSPWLSLAVLVDFAEEPDLAERIIGGEKKLDGVVASERTSYRYALGKAYADLAEHALAFDCFDEAARLMRTHTEYSRERDRFTATDAVDGYDAKAIAAIARLQSEPTDRGIFVTGLPRSGTTLVEQILTSHSEVCDGGEIYRLSLLVKDVGGLSHRALCDYIEKTGASAAARLWRHWLDERFPVPGRVVDKTLHTSRLLGLAAALLPEAPLIWLTRDPLDCAWSCFRNRFAGEAPWSLDQADIAYHFRLEDELLAKWQEILGDRLLVLPYESLANEPEPWIRRLLAHCGLSEEPGPFAPHENGRSVTTSSVMQVRQPINRKGIGAAEPYREFLQPFIDAYYD
ncbi:MAG TPA: sulfotransferase [Sphingomonadaceae bacterium]|nr:sulfotransferase [Sphingomonadaceae bacterium]